MILRGRPIFVTFFILAVLVAYGGCYWLLVRPGEISLERLGASVIYDVQPRYAVGGAAAATIFTPAHLVDRLLRPEYWAGQKPIPRRGRSRPPP